MSNRSVTELRKKRVAEGLCATCGARRDNYDWHCDLCAKKHRERQRPRRLDVVDDSALHFTVAPNADGQFDVHRHLFGSEPRVIGTYATQEIAEKRAEAYTARFA